MTSFHTPHQQLKVIRFINIIIQSLVSFDVLADAMIAPGVDLTIPQISNQLHANMLTFQASFGIRQDDKDAVEEEKKIYEENLRDEGRQQERERQALNMGFWDDLDKEIITPLDHDKADNLGHEMKPVKDRTDEQSQEGTHGPSSSQKGRPDRIEKESKSHLPPRDQKPMKQRLENPFTFDSKQYTKRKPTFLPAQGPSIYYPSKGLTDIHQIPLQSPSDIRDAAMIQSAIDVEFLAASHALQQLKAVRNHIATRINQIQSDPYSGSPSSLIDEYPFVSDHPLIQKNLMNRLREQSSRSIPHHDPNNQYKTISSAAMNIYEELDTAMSDLNEKFPTASDEDKQHTKESPSFPIMDALFANSLPSGMYDELLEICNVIGLIECDISGYPIEIHCLSSYSMYLSPHVVVSYSRE